MLNLNHRIAAIAFSSIVHVWVTVALSFSGFEKQGPQHHSSPTATIVAPAMMEPSGATAASIIQPAFASPAPAPVLPVNSPGSISLKLGAPPVTQVSHQQILVVHRPTYSPEVPAAGASITAIAPVHLTEPGSESPAPSLLAASGGRVPPRTSRRPLPAPAASEVALLDPPGPVTVKPPAPPEPQAAPRPQIVRGVMKSHLRESQLQRANPPRPPALQPEVRVPVDRMPRRIAGRAPFFPRREMFRARDGQVLLNLQLSATGRVVRVEVAVSSGSALYDAAAISAANTWRYTPALRNGRAVPYVLQAPVKFIAGMRAF